MERYLEQKYFGWKWILEWKCLMFRSFPACFHRWLLELVWPCLFGVLVSTSGIAGWIWGSLESLCCCFWVREIPSAMPANFRPPNGEVPTTEKDSQLSLSGGNPISGATNFDWTLSGKIPAVERRLIERELVSWPLCYRLRVGILSAERTSFCFRVGEIRTAEWGLRVGESQQRRVSTTRRLI